jgi:L-lactate dehydrogenase complex protein LldF
MSGPTMDTSDLSIPLRTRTARRVRDTTTQRALRVTTNRLSDARVGALAAIDDADALRDAARAARSRTLAQLPALLEQLADNLRQHGVHVCWADDADAANRYIASVAQQHGARTAVKSKSMASEEIGLNTALAAVGCRAVETDLGEWVIQLAHEHPSHIILPALHRDRHQIADVLRAQPGGEDLADDPPGLVAFAREQLREEFLRADIGITGANFAVAESGSIVLVTNEGNGRLVSTLPRVHIAVLGMERIVGGWDELDLLLTLLTRSATGQPLTTYTNIITGPRRNGESDGPDEMHVVILDNGRSEIVGSEFHEILACIRCGACLNVCPVYRQTGGHAYGWVYSGPVGAVLTPLLLRTTEGAHELANASTLCGACMDACPVGIPLQDLLLRQRLRNARHASRTSRAAWRAWSVAWSSPRGYRATTSLTSRLRPALGLLARAPFVRARTAGRTIPRPARRTFQRIWSRSGA